MTIDIYTDARSGRARKIQIAAVAVDENDNEYHFVEKTSIGRVKSLWSDFISTRFKANSGIAEMYSIYRTLIELNKLDLPIKKVNIYTDSLNSFYFINEVNKDPNANVGYISNNKTITPKCHLVKMINNHIKISKSQLEAKNIQVEIMWVRGHDGCYFNEVVDKLCKPYSEQVNDLGKIVNL